MHKKQIIKLSFLVILLISIFTNVFAGVGTKAGNFLKIVPEPRGMAMGEAVVSIVNDASSIYWNPAGLAMAEKPTVIFSYNKWLQDISQGFIAANTKPGKMGAIGIGATYLDSGEFMGYDGDDNEIGKVSGQDTCIMLGYASSLMNKKLSLGLGYKYVDENLDGSKASGHGVDVGLIYRMFKNHINIGCSLQNLVSTDIKFEEEEAALEKMTKIGVAYKGIMMKDKKFILSAQTSIEEKKDNKIGAGLELEIYKPLIIRAGYQNRDLGSGIMGGFGITVRGIDIDYSLSDYGDFDYTHTISLKI